MFLKIFAIFTKETPVLESLIHNCIKNRLWCGCFPVNIVIILKKSESDCFMFNTKSEFSKIKKKNIHKLKRKFSLVANIVFLWKHNEGKHTGNVFFPNILLFLKVSFMKIYG